VAAALASLALAAALRGGIAWPWQPPALPDYGAAPAFGLTDQLGRPVTSDALRGRVVVADFVYTSCTDTCPLLSLRMQSLQGRLAAAGLLGRHVQLLSFSIDPARDTPDTLHAYAERYLADRDGWRFLTGPERYVTPVVVQGFRLGVQPVPLAAAEPGGAPSAARYDVMHSNRFVLIDRGWRIRAYRDGLEVDADRMLREVRALLR
jgi:protein SCO1